MKYLKYIILIIALSGITDAFAQHKAEIIVKGVKVDDLLDSIELNVMVPGGIPFYPNSAKKYRKAWNGREVKFEVEVYGTPTYFTLIAGQYRIVNSLVESGDKIVINHDPLNTKFEGKNILKNQVSYNLMDMIKTISGRLKHKDPSTIKYEMELRDSLTLAKVEYLKKFKGRLSDTVYNMMMLDVMSDSYTKTGYLTNYIRGSEIIPFSQALKPYTLSKEIIEIESLLLQLKIEDQSLTYGPSLVQNYIFEHFFRNGLALDFNKIFNHFLTLPDGALKEKILSYLIYKNRKDSDAIASIDKALEYVENPLYKETLENLRDTFNGRTTLASYSLVDSKGALFSLSQLKGNIVVVDFWYTGCPGCPYMVPFLYKLEKKFKGAPIMFISVSIDKEREKWLKSLASGLYTTSQGIHLYTGGVGSLHSFVSDFFITRYPTVLVFDKEGMISRVPKDPRLDNAEDICRVLEALLIK